VRVLIAGGATGGHLFPGIAAAEALRERGARVLFLCSPRPFDARELSRAGFDFRPLPAAPFEIKRFHRTCWGAARSLGEASRAVREFRPDVVVGLGGFPSAAPVAIAALRGIPYVLLEQNSVPGRVTRLFCRGARRVFVQWDCVRRRLGPSARAIGSPIRSGLARLDKAEARRILQIPDGKIAIVVLGGSQGARRLNERLMRGAAALGGAAPLVHLLHQTGPADRPAAEDGYREMGLSARVFDFEPRMDRLYAAADFAICRAGALTLQELSYFHVPAVLVPLPESADGHQLNNARILERSGCALLREERRLHSGFLLELVLSYLAESEGFSRRGRALGRYFRHDARTALATELLGLAG
jgi:UDP-N-acetylglucosamine--N-acetylmuramyl-(pentapeptide) pyrophosphoryl-undecaprenol N-acetylglucosamine transferase